MRKSNMIFLIILLSFSINSYFDGLFCWAIDNSTLSNTDNKSRPVNRSPAVNKIITIENYNSESNVNVGDKHNLKQKTKNNPDGFSFSTTSTVNRRPTSLLLLTGEDNTLNLNNRNNKDEENMESAFSYTRIILILILIISPVIFFMFIAYSRGSGKRLEGQNKN